jgi:hypothetical protein
LHAKFRIIIQFSWRKWKSEQWLIL